MPNIVETEAKMRKRGRWLCRAGWAAFAVSLALPAVHVFDWMSGWTCFRVVVDIAWGAVTGRGGWPSGGWSLYYSLFALANMILLASPLFIRLFRHNMRWMRRSSLLLSAATLYTASLLLLALPRGWEVVGDWHIGYYVWLLSFGMVTTGTMHLSLCRPNNLVNQRPSVMGRTKEELMAVLELEEFLNEVEQMPVEGEQLVDRDPNAAGIECNADLNRPEMQNVNWSNFTACLRPSIAEG